MPFTISPLATLAILLAINLWTVFCFWQDKARARNGLRRIPESRLLDLALLGGTWPAACSGTRRASSRSPPCCC